MDKELAKDIYDSTKLEIEKHKLKLQTGLFSPQKKVEVEKAISEAEEALQNLKAVIDRPF